MKTRSAARFMSGLLLVGSAVFLGLAPSARDAIAAEPTDQTTAAASDQLENVIVTARRVEESQQRVPVALTALSQRDLDQQVVLDVQDLETSTPGLYVAENNEGGAPTFTIRGAKTEVGASPTVAVYMDDVPVVSTLAVANMVYDMQSITTLKGPQSTLFGADSTGGAIVFRPNKPTDTFEGYAQIGLGNYDRKEFQAMVNVPVNEMLQVRVAGEIVRREGFETNLSPTSTPDNHRIDDDNHESLRLSVRLRLSDTLLNDTVVDYYHLDDQANQGWAKAYRPTYEYSTFVGITLPVSYSAAGVHVLPPFDVETSKYPTWDKAHYYGVANTTTWDVTSNWTLKSVFGYRNDNQDVAQDYGDTGTFAVVVGRTLLTTQQWTLEPSSTISWDDGRWTNKLGIFLSYSDQHHDLSDRVIGLPFDFTGLPPVVETTVDAFYPLQVNELQDTRLKSESLYDQLSVKLSNELTFTAGARYSYDQGNYLANNRTVFASTPGGIGPFGDFTYGPCANYNYMNYNPVTCAGTQSLRTNAPSFTLSLEDQFAERKMLYASLRGGYLEGGFNNQVSVPAGQVFQPEKVTEFEGGLKADWDAAGRPLRTNVAIFYGTYKNQQREQNGTSASGITYEAVANAGSTLFYGTDVDLNYAVTSWLDLQASWEYLISQYTNYNAALDVPGITSSLDLTGSQESQAPKDVFTAGATLRWPLSQELGALSTTLSYYYRSRSLGQDAPTIGGSCAGNTPATPVITCTAPGTFIPNNAQNYTAYDILPAFGIANMTTQWKGIGGTHVDVELWVKNLTNKLYYTYNENQFLQFGYATFYLGDPRTFGARLRYNF